MQSEERKSLEPRDDNWMAHINAARIILKNQDRNGWEERIYAALREITAGTPGTK
jgi:hypothetical protein